MKKLGSGFYHGTNDSTPNEGLLILQFLDGLYRLIVFLISAVLFIVSLFPIFEANQEWENTYDSFSFYAELVSESVFTFWLLCECIVVPHSIWKF